MKRRDFLKAAAGATALAPGFQALALGDESRFRPAVIKHAGNWNTRPTGLRRLCWEVAGRTSVEVYPDPRPFEPDDRELFYFPFAYFGGDGPYPPLSEAAVTNLRRYLTYGGFILADANDGSDGDGFDASFRRDISRILPANPLTRVSPEHVIFKSYYLLDHHAGRLLARGADPR